jgi:protein-L-isoaspartate(D-aspartate) O-methyltransferase
MPELLALSRSNLNRYHFTNVRFEKATKEIGYPGMAPYNKIHTSSYTQEISEELISQLVVGGILVAPVKNSVYKIEKISDYEYKTKTYPGYNFLPLINIETISERKSVDNELKD